MHTQLAIKNPNLSAKIDYFGAPIYTAIYESSAHLKQYSQCANFCPISWSRFVNDTPTESFESDIIKSLLESMMMHQACHTSFLGISPLFPLPFIDFAQKATIQMGLIFMVIKFLGALYRFSINYQVIENVPFFVEFLPQA